MFFPVGHGGNDAIVIHRDICAYYHGFSSYMLQIQSVGVVNVFIFITFYVLACGFFLLASHHPIKTIHVNRATSYLRLEVLNAFYG